MQQDKANEEAEHKRRYEETLQKIQSRYKKRNEENKERKKQATEQMRDLAEKTKMQ